MRAHRTGTREQRTAAEERARSKSVAATTTRSDQAAHRKDRGAARGRDDRHRGDALSPRDLRDANDMDRAAATLHAAIAAFWAMSLQKAKREAAESYQAQLTSLQQRYESNEQLLATARTRLTDLEGDIDASAQREVELATRLSRATADFENRLAAPRADLDEANLKIAQYEEPVDPQLLAANRRKLLEVPDTVRLAWSPFDLPDVPAEQQQVRGDVVWNDELQEGYLRFEGLAVNDPAVEQYQVWVIDERGMEQKVSGGIFNATRDGEVIVPIHPGVDVGRVALFAVTIEEPGGTWVPDLRRRVVVAPCDS